MGRFRASEPLHSIPAADGLGSGRGLRKLFDYTFPRTILPAGETG